MVHTACGSYATYATYAVVHNSGSDSDKTNIRTPALSCLGFGDTNDIVQKKNAEQIQNGECIFPLCPISCAIDSTFTDSMKTSMLEICISISE